MRHARLAKYSMETLCGLSTVWAKSKRYGKARPNCDRCLDRLDEIRYRRARQTARRK